MAGILIDPETVGDPIRSDIAKRLNLPFDIPGIRAEMERMLNIPECGNFVRRLLALAASPANPLVAGGDVLKVFDMINKPPNKGLVRAGDTDRGARTDVTSNVAIGSIGGKNAQIQVGSFRPGKDPSTLEEVKRGYLKSDAQMCLHETIHLCGENVYNDEYLAQVVFGMVGGEPPPIPIAGQDMRTRFSVYWDNALRKTYERK